MSHSLRAAGALAAVVTALALGGPVPYVSATDAPAPSRLFRIADPAIDESSGLATSTSLPGVLWTVNDSGGTPQVFGLDGRGRTVATLTLDGATNRDWEAVAVGPRAGGGTWVWVGDIGDNNAVWSTVRVYRVAEPTGRGDRSVPWQAYDLSYPDGPRDAEALLVDPTDGRLYVVSKRVQGAAVYRAPAVLSTDRVNRLTRLAPAPSLVTDGAFAPDGRVALRDYLQAWLSPGVRGPREATSLPLQPQGESLTWTADGTSLVVGSEGVHSAVWQVPLAAPAPPRTATSAPPPSSSSAAGSPAASTDPVTDDGPSPWLVVLAGLVVGGAAAGILRAVRRRRPPAG